MCHSHALVGWLGFVAAMMLVVGCASVTPCGQGQVRADDGLCYLPCDVPPGVNCNDGNDCTTDGCNDLPDGTAQCTNVDKADDTVCTSGALGGWCVSGACDFCRMVNCEDGSACTLDGTCNAGTGQCEGGDDAPDGTECVTGENPGTCLDGVCEGLCKDVVCNDNQQCTDDTCDSADGECDFTPVEEGAPCDFGGLPGRCVSGQCEDASPPSVFFSEGTGVMSSSQYQMGISIGGPVAQGTAQSANHTLEFRAPLDQ